jgi:isopentenyl diphosphate isomerase/L-lactate dehydrogenase-like FMN-dependent dehydrogenase
MAGQFLKAAAVSTEQVVEMMKLTKRQIEVTMFACGAERLEGLKVGKLVELKSEKDFYQILEAVLEKNKELYKRLANL